MQFWLLAENMRSLLIAGELLVRSVVEGRWFYAATVYGTGVETGAKAGGPHLESVSRQGQGRIQWIEF